MKWLKDSGVDKLRVYATIQNPFVIWSPYTNECGLDPETNSNGDQNIAVAGLARLPIIGTNSPATRNFILGVNLTF